MRRNPLWEVAFAIVAGVLVGFALRQVTLSSTDRVFWMLIILLLAGFGAWFQIGVQPYGSLNLSPVVFLVTASAFGIWEGVIAAALAPLLAVAVRRFGASSPTNLLQGFSAGGEAALSLVLAAGVVNLLPLQRSNELIRLLELTVTALLTAFGLTAVHMTIAERVSFKRLVAPLGRKVLPHFAAMLAAVPAVWLTFSVIGPLGIVLSVVIMIETYYPWKLLREQRELFLNSLQMMASAVDLKDPYTAYHSKRVAGSAVVLARALDVPEEEVERIRIGALLHDIGKIAVTGSIIRKPSKLTDEEMSLMKSHVEAGAGLIEGLEILDESTEIVLHHHENYDGSGYPSGIAGEAIPLGSRIVFVADAFDALTTDRPYRKGRSPAEAMEVLKDNAVTQFDPRVVGVLRKVIGTEQ